MMTIQYSPEWHDEQLARGKAVIEEAKNVAELGAKDGAKWARKHPRASAMQAAVACQAAHFKRIDQGRVAADDVITYGQAFVDAALDALSLAQEDR